MKKNTVEKNFLEKKPLHFPGLIWTGNAEGNITLHIENSGFFNFIAQKILKKPRITHVHLDEVGSFLWPLMDGEKNIIELGEYVETHFGEKIYPLYERLAKYFQILESYHFIIFN